MRNVLRDPMTLRRTRLACGLVMFTYLALHLCMHALGNVSFDAMQWATRVHDAVWHSLPGTVLLYGALAIHFTLALYALYARRSFRMGAGEITRLVLGFSIVPIMVAHFAGGRYVWSAFGVARTYDSLLPALYAAGLIVGSRDALGLLVAWTHGCLGIHFWLRERTWYARYAPLLLALAVLLPVLALLGVWEGTKEIVAREGVRSAYDYGSGTADSDAIAHRSDTLVTRLYWTYVLLVAGVFLARGIRRLVERRRGSVAITYPGGRVVRVPKGYSVLEASRTAHIPHASICGGRGRCTTCRIGVLRGFEAQPPPQNAERLALARLHAGPNVRLACQLRPQTDIAILPLLPPGVTANDPARFRESASMERFVAIMFIDIRRSTALFEKRLPYDVVFLLNHFFDAVGGAVAVAGGAPNQFIGDGMMVIFGMRTGPRDACAQALRAAGVVSRRLDEMNVLLRNELASPIAVGVGLHAGNAILGEIGYADRFLLTAIGDTVNVAARLQDATKEYGCELVVSQALADAAEADLGAYPAHEIRVRGREAPLAIRVVPKMAELASAQAQKNGPGSPGADREEG
jgi:adenylate cyclase